MARLGRNGGLNGRPVRARKLGKHKLKAEARKAGLVRTKQKEYGKKVVKAGENEADEDIRAGRVKTFDNPEDLIANLKQPW